MIQDNVAYQTSAQMQTFYAENTDRLTIYQLPAYSPDLTSIEALWKNVKKDATPLRWFPHFTDRVTKVSTTLTKLAGLPRELTALMGEYRFLTLPAD